MKQQMMVSSFHLVESLATGLYETEGQRLMELVRNSLVASMDKNKWQPKRAKIEISLVPNHPLAKREAALVVLDHGSGLTAPDLEKYFGSLGTPHKHVGSSSTGASQHGIGRLAAFALNEKCVGEDYGVARQNGYYLLTRTSATGKVRFVSVIPKMVDEGGFETDEWIQPDSTEMGSLKNIQGSFTAVVIPTPIFKTHAEIWEAIKWFLPREQDKMFELLIAGKTAVLPALEKTLNLTSEDGKFRARLGVGTKDSNGVWLCDSETGFRVASCQSMGHKLIPDPLWYPDMVGDIFAPGLLRYQNTARSTLSKEFTRANNKQWQHLRMFLIGQVAPQAKQLIDRDVIAGAAAEALDELVAMFKDRFGEPEDDSPSLLLPGLPKDKSNGSNGKQSDGSSSSRGRSGERRKRHETINVRGESYTLYGGQSLHPHVFAIGSSNPRVIMVNIRGSYASLPPTKAARMEHILMQILTAIGMEKHSLNLQEAIRFANDVRGDFLK